MLPVKWVLQDVTFCIDGLTWLFFKGNVSDHLLNAASRVLSFGLMVHWTYLASLCQS